MQSATIDGHVIEEWQSCRLIFRNRRRRVAGGNSTRALSSLKIFQRRPYHGVADVSLTSYPGTAFPFKLSRRQISPGISSYAGLAAPKCPPVDEENVIRQHAINSIWPICKFLFSSYSFSYCFLYTLIIGLQELYVNAMTLTIT